MRIDDKILSIPPYISTAWSQVASLHVENQLPTHVLIVTLNNGTRIEIPNLAPTLLKSVFDAHTHHLESEAQTRMLAKSGGSPGAQTFSFSLPLGNLVHDLGLDNLTSLLQHNPEQADGPDLPADLLEKIATLGKTIGAQNPDMLPKAEAHCNCVHCQIARSLNSVDAAAPEQLEEIVSDEELQFRTWDIAQNGEKLYTVTNPLDSDEHYQVFLGDPVGCTCGHHHCEHVRAVLSS